MSRARTIANFGDGLVTADLPSDLGIVGGDLPAGSVLQTVTSNTDLTINIQTGSTSFATVSDAEIAITPISANSKIRVYMGGWIMHFNPDANPQNKGGSVTIMRSVNSGSFANVTGGRGLDGIFKVASGGSHWEEHVAHLEYLDEPTYTVGQEIKYRAGFRRQTNTDGAFYLNHNGGLYNNGNPIRVVFIAQEIAG